MKAEKEICKIMVLVLGRSLTVQLDCLKDRVVCGTVYGDAHFEKAL